MHHDDHHHNGSSDVDSTTARNLGAGGSTVDLPIRQAAERMNVSVDTVRRRLRRGELSGYFEPDGRKWIVQVPIMMSYPSDPNGVPLTWVVDMLRQELASRNEEVARLTALLEKQMTEEPSRGGT